MLSLDIATLLLVITLVGFLLAGLITLAAIVGRERASLLNLAGAYVLYGLGAASVMAFSVFYGRTEWLTIWVTNILFLAAYGMVLCSLRRFAGRSSCWAWGLAGMLVWTVLCLALWPWFGQVTWIRVVVYSGLVVAYMLAAIAQVLPEWRVNARVVTPVLFLLVVHALCYMYRMLAWIVTRASGPVAFDYALINFESLLFAVGLAVSILLMVRGRAEYQFRHASLHDELTGLPNRRALFAKGAKLLETAREAGSDAVLLMCDLDLFKRVNDRFGHAVGDRVLKAFSSVLRQSVDAGNLVARLGGEEFVVLATGKSLAEAQALGTRIRDQLGADGTGLPALQTTSIGVACSGDAGHDLDRLLTQADRALYAAKTAGRDCLRVWSDDLPDTPSGSVARGDMEEPAA